MVVVGCVDCVMCKRTVVVGLCRLDVGGVGTGVGTGVVDDVGAVVRRIELLFPSG